MGKKKSMHAVDIVDYVSSDIEEKMQNGLVSYEQNCGIDVNYKRLSFVLMDDLKEVIGVLNVYTVFSEIYVDDIWIDDKHRGKGYGKKLIIELESYFKGKGFNNINLVTSAFQAPEFYQKCGFELEFVRKNVCNPKLTKFFFIKYFDELIQTQGIYDINKLLDH